jgi:hypothetical protein
MRKMTWRLLGEGGIRLADSFLSHVNGHAPVGVLTPCPFDWMRQTTTPVHEGRLKWKSGDSWVRNKNGRDACAYRPDSLMKW